MNNICRCIKNLISAVILLLLFSSCTSENQPVRYSDLAVISVPNISDGIYIELILDIEKALEAEGIEVEITSAGDDVKGQIEGIYEELLEEPDYLLIYPVSYYGLEDVIGYADNQGTKVIALGNDIQLNERSDLRASVMHDHLHEGVQSASLIGQYYHGITDTKYVLEIQGPLGPTVTRDVAKGFREQLLIYDTLELIDVSQDNQDRVDAYNNTREMINRHGANISVVFAHNDQLGLGAYDALMEAEFDMKTIPVITIGGGTDVQNAITADLLHGTVMRTGSYGDAVVSIIRDKDTPYSYVELDSKIFLSQGGEGQ